MATALLLGLEISVAEELSRALIYLKHQVQLSPMNQGALESTEADLVFAPAGDLRAILRVRPDLPVVVASRLPEISAWLDALQDGAADYCGAPFEATQIGWVLNSSLRGMQRAAAA